MLKSPIGRWAVIVAALLVGGAFHVRRERVASAPSDSSAQVTVDRTATRAMPRESATQVDPVAMPSAAGSSVARPALFRFVQPANAAALDAALPAPARAIHYVRVDTALIAGKRSPFWQPPGAGRVALPLPNGGALTVVIDGSEMLGADRFTSTGHVEGEPQSRAVFAYNAGFLHASVEGSERGTFALRVATEDVSQFYQVDPALVPPCGGVLRPVITPAVLAEAEARKARQAALAGAGTAQAAAPGTAAAENPQRAEVHVLMVYTQAVLPTLTGTARTAALQSAFDAAIAKTNAAFTASLITARVRLVGIAETQYDENASSGTRVQEDALTALAATADGKMDDVHALRDQVGADIVCLALNRTDFASIGLSFVLDEPGGNLNAQFAFAVVQYGTVGGTNVVPHELGHIFGCAHDRANSTNPADKDYAGAYPYSYGYRFTGADGRTYHDIMAYPPGTEVSYFSNPDVIAPAPVSRATGIAPGQPGEADAALTIEQTAFEVSTFRLQTQAAANAGTLINVATRAFVGTGDQVLIAGFVVDGTQPKRMLLRAAGPALTAFGVPGVLGNPTLRVVAQANGAQVAFNDNWSAQTTDSAADVSAAAAQVAAFPFAANSADAALLVTLTPGAYTAVVEGVGGVTGSGLVEAYDVDRGANKVINLSTRGYADRGGKEMFGGFVVQGAAGSTKRILVRVLGPTLGRTPYNITSAMNDPFLEVHNATGELLLQNDDWSSGTAVGPANPVNDFSPKVTYYNEKKISATGFAPANRREPCVLMDLAPGNYTVIVKPFELRDSDPALDEPAQPGVAIVEVYEVNQ